jgi:hypothetical protein
MKIRPAGAELFHEDGRRDRYDESNMLKVTHVKRILGVCFLVNEISRVCVCVCVCVCVLI